MDDDGIKMLKPVMTCFRIVGLIFSREILLINEMVKRGPAENQAFSAQSLWKIPMKIHVLFDGKTRTSACASALASARATHWGVKFVFERSG